MHLSKGTEAWRWQLQGQIPVVESICAAAMPQVRLSSAAVPDENDDTTVVIGPPFYLEAKVAGFNIPIQDTQPGGGRKSILGNELNYFRQLYVENSGKPGDLRVSEVYAGDPAVKGSIFVHERM